jgi:hypothetical protein
MSIRRSNPKRKCGKPCRFSKLKFLKGSGELGEKNGIDFDQYDQTYDGSLFPRLSEFDFTSINDIIHDIIINLNHKFNTLPRKAKSNIFGFLFRNCNIDWIQYDFIDAENYINNNVKTINNINDSNDEFDFNTDETDTDEDNYSEYTDED